MALSAIIIVWNTIVGAIPVVPFRGAIPVIVSVLCDRTSQLLNACGLFRRTVSHRLFAIRYLREPVDTGSVVAVVIHSINKEVVYRLTIHIPCLRILAESIHSIHGKRERFVDKRGDADSEIYICKHSISENNLDSMRPVVIM